MNLPTSSHAYGIGPIAVIVGIAIVVSYYQLYFIPELNAKPIILENILLELCDPIQTITIVNSIALELHGFPLHME
ncbi:MAG: hypothetical protein ACREA1_04705 [Nitrosotalea sp.]